MNDYNGNPLIESCEKASLYSRDYQQNRDKYDHAEIFSKFQKTSSSNQADEAEI